MTRVFSARFDARFRVVLLIGCGLATGSGAVNVLVDLYEQKPVDEVSVVQYALAHIADASSAEDVRAGRVIYKTYCSQCHGRNLQGQALWQVLDEYAGRRAPAHDDSGHTWQHPDEDIYQKIRSGHLPKANPSAVSYMPAFENILGEGQILQVMAYIKARWSLGIRVAQSTLNPDFAGMPRDADSVEWTFPPDCTTSWK